MIPAEAVEAAAKVLYFEDHLWDEPWETVSDAGKYRTNARAALEAAAPHMLAAAWDECEAATYEIRLNTKTNAWEPVKDNPYRTPNAR